MNGNNGFNIEGNERTLKDYIIIVRTNLLPIILITLTGLIVAITYAANAIDIFNSTTVLKLSKPNGGILESPILPEFQDFGSDRFIANELEVLKSRTVREKIVNNLLQEIKNGELNLDELSVVLKKDDLLENKPPRLLSKSDIIEILANANIEQKRGLDIVEISFESPSPFEAALICNLYAKAYSEINLEFNRTQVKNVKTFLSKQRNEKYSELIKSEDQLKDYQESGGIIALSDQATSLIQQLTQFESQKYSAEIELSISKKTLKSLKTELDKKNPSIKLYIEQYASEPRLKSLQTEIAKLESQRDLTVSSSKIESERNSIINEHNAKIESLQAKLDKQLSKYQESLFAATPEELKQISLDIFKEEVNAKAKEASIKELTKIIDFYETKFNALPARTLELARFERSRTVLEKLYLLVEEKYQEALITEQSTPGNVIVIDNAQIPIEPSKPNRQLIIIVGFVLGLGLGFAFAFVKEYFDNTIKTPDDIQNRNIPVLAWIPQIEGIQQDSEKHFEFIVARKPDSIPSEAFRALRTRIMFSRVDTANTHTILVTSSAPREGKTLVSVNLAGSFAQATKRTVVLDCDLRKPRVHNVFKVHRLPGFSDYIFGQNTYEEIVRETEVENLSLISAGTIPPNPSEILGSNQMTDFLEKLKSEYDIVIIDSPPIIAVTDAEILARLADATLLVVSANITEVDMMSRSIELLDTESTNFAGTVLNNFSYRSGYGSYYKYYYYYSRKDIKTKPKKKMIKA